MDSLPPCRTARSLGKTHGIDIAYHILGSNQISRTAVRHRAERELDLSHADASRGRSDRSHHVPSIRLRPAVPCHTSGTIVEFGIDIAYHILGSNQISRTAVRHRAERELDLSHADASRGRSDRSHHVPSIRLRPAVPCHTSGTIVEFGIESPITNLNILQTGRTELRHMGGARWLSVRLDRRGALRELDLGPTARRTGGDSAEAHDTCVETAHRIVSHEHGLSLGPPAAPCRSAECKEHLAK